jgi:hypothetical protein
MKPKFNALLIVAFRGATLISAISLGASVRAEAANSQRIARDGLTLELHQDVAKPDKAYADSIIEAFFKIYPVIISEYNMNAPRTVIVTVSDNYKGVGQWADGGGGPGGNEIRIKNAMRKFSAVHSELRVFTHELMHLAQPYRGTLPSWFVEGIADYVSTKIRPIDDGGKLLLPPPPEDGRYTMGYGWVARFLIFLENGYPGLSKELHWAALDGSYSEATWLQLTGQTLDDLWKSYKIVDGFQASTYRYLRPTRSELERFRAAIALTENGVKAGKLPKSVLEVQRTNLAAMDANLGRHEAHTSAKPK